MSYVKTNIWLQYMFHSVCAAGLLVSGYALVVEFHKDSDPSYVPLCDFSESISCTKALMSKWSRGFGIVGPLLGDDHILNQRNPVMGIIFYTLLMILGSFNHTTVALLNRSLIVVSNLASIYLALIMYFDIRSLCVVCLSTYVVNFVLLLLAVWRLKTLRKMKRKRD